MITISKVWFCVMIVAIVIAVTLVIIKIGLVMIDRKTEREERYRDLKQLIWAVSKDVNIISRQLEELKENRDDRD